jgi:hypothetical protein
MIPRSGGFCSGPAAWFASLSIRVASIHALVPGTIRERPFAWRPTALGISKVGVLTRRMLRISPQKGL